MSKKSKQKLLVFFDTNVLHTNSESDLVRNEIKNLIKENRSHIDLDISWYIPEMVVGERKYQMLRKARELMPNLRKLEKLLGHNLAITEDTLLLHVDKAIKSSVDTLSLIRIDIDVAEVDWNDVISRSVSRDVPFELGEKEKGFRDVIIANTFLQLHSNSPVTSSVCLLALVTNDSKLTEYIKEKTALAKNVRVFKNVAELEGLINALTSKISEELAESITEKASGLFFSKGEPNSLYYKENIEEAIEEKYKEEGIDSCLRDSQQKSLKKWWISQTIFEKKIRQRVYFSTTIEVEFEIWHYGSIGSEYDFPDSAVSYASRQMPFPSLETGLDSYSNQHAIIQSATSIASQLGIGVLNEPIIDHKGRDIFEVKWDASINSSKSLSRPSISSISYLGNDLGSSLLD